MRVDAMHTLKGSREPHVAATHAGQKRGNPSAQEAAGLPPPDP